MKQDYCIATYRCFDEKADFHKKALGIAVGMTVGSWTDLPEAKKQSMEQHLGHVVSVVEHVSATGERYADIKIAYPDVNFSADLPALLVTIYGKVSMDGKLKLIDVDFSERFLAAFHGPKFGIQGVRDLLNVHDRPMLMSIFKSVIGHDLSGLREQFLAQALGGVDLIKDDEILFENPLTPIEKRVEVCRIAAEQASHTTGQRLLYAVNLTGPTFHLREQAKKAIAAGATAFLFNVLAYGFDVLHAMSSDPEITVPIMAHPAMAGAFYPSPYHGIHASLVLGKFMRLAGADIVLFPSPYGSVVMPREDNMAIKQALLTSDLPVKQSLPVPSAGIHPALVPLIVSDFGSEVIVNAGGGIFGHPLGTEAGGRAFRQAIEAVQHGSELSDYAAIKNYQELQVALATWGEKK
jgi:2,3-diketo-5-methylthiopentyl-1-phosphate enolase